MDKSIIPKVWNFPTQICLEQEGFARMPGVDWETFWEEAKEMNLCHAEITITQVVDWDRAPMRKYFHGVQVVAFMKKYNETTTHPKNVIFDKHTVKDFLKVKFLGWDRTSVGYRKWSEVLGLRKPIADILDYTKFAEINAALDTPVDMVSTEDIIPARYMRFIHECEGYYFELFNESYDVRERPQL